MSLRVFPEELMAISQKVWLYEFSKVGQSMSYISCTGRHLICIVVSKLLTQPPGTLKNSEPEPDVKYMYSVSLNWIQRRTPSYMYYNHLNWIQRRTSSHRYTVALTYIGLTSGASGAGDTNFSLARLIPDRSWPNLDRRSALAWP